MADRIIEALAGSTDGLDDGRLATAIDARRQTVSQAARKLAEQGKIVRIAGPSGLIVNTLPPPVSDVPKAEIETEAEAAEAVVVVAEAEAVTADGAARTIVEVVAVEVVEDPPAEPVDVAEPPVETAEPPAETAEPEPGLVAELAEPAPQPVAETKAEVAGEADEAEAVDAAAVGGEAVDAAAVGGEAVDADAEAEVESEPEAEAPPAAAVPHGSPAVRGGTSTRRRWWRRLRVRHGA